MNKCPLCCIFTMYKFECNYFSLECTMLNFRPTEFWISHFQYKKIFSINHFTLAIFQQLKIQLETLGSQEMRKLEINVWQQQSKNTQKEIFAPLPSFTGFPYPAPNTPPRTVDPPQLQLNIRQKLQARCIICRKSYEPVRRTLKIYFDNSRENFF